MSQTDKLCEACGGWTPPGFIHVCTPQHRISALERENKRLREALRELTDEAENDEKGFGRSVPWAIGKARQALLAEQPASAQQGGGECH